MSRGLTDRMRKFIAEYGGPGDGTRAGRAAGYSGDDRTVSVTVARLMKDPRIADALEAKARAKEVARVAELAERAKGWTTSARLAELREIAESKEATPLDRIRAIRLGSEIVGDVGPKRFDPPQSPPAPSTAPDVGDESDDPDVHVPPRLLLLKGTHADG